MRSLLSNQLALAWLLRGGGRFSSFCRSYISLIAVAGTFATARANLFPQSFSSSASLNTSSAMASSEEFSAAFVTCPGEDTAKKLARKE
jgi:hypothetical protein